MQLNAALNLVFPIRWGTADANGVRPVTVWAHHSPISRDVFEANYRIIAATNMAIFARGVGYAAESGPIIATLALKDAAQQDALEHGTDVASIPLLAEIKRLTAVLAASGAGYEMLPVDQAIARGAIDAEDWSEAEASIVFFTCGSWMARREKREEKKTALALVLRGSISSLLPSEFADSLATLTATETSEASSPSSVPS